MKDPCDWHIYLHEWLMFVVNVCKYTVHGAFGKGNHQDFRSEGGGEILDCLMRSFRFGGGNSNILGNFAPGKMIQFDQHIFMGT